MDLYVLARTIQADKNRAIEAESRRRLLLTTAEPTSTVERAATRTSRSTQRSTSTSAASR